MYIHTHGYTILIISMGTIHIKHINFLQQIHLIKTGVDYRTMEEFFAKCNVNY